MSKTLTDEQLKLLKSALAPEAITKHPTKTYLSSIKAIYVTERLNDVFGVGAWQIKTNHITTTEKGMVVVKVELSIPEYGIYYESFGGNDNGGDSSKNFDLGDAFKGATTDAITKIGSYLGIGIDVFKGKTPVATPTPSAPASTSSAQGNDLPWLNVFDKEKNFTREWSRLITKKQAKEPIDIKELRKFYKISKEVEVKINELINQ
jgi:hypothetical protein